MKHQAVFLEAFSRINQEVDHALDDIDAQALVFRADPDANSVAWLIWHLSRVQDDHISEIAGQPQAYVADGWAHRLGLPADEHDTGYGHTSEHVDAVRIESPDILAEYYTAVAERTRAYLSSMQASDLDRIIDDRWDPPVSVGVRLVSVVSDCLQHAGQANYVRGLSERQAR